MPLTLPIAPPFSLASIIRSHGWYQLLPFQCGEDATRLSYTSRLSSGKVILLEISQSDEGVTLDVSGRLTQTEQHEVNDQVRWMLGLEQDLSSFYDLADKEPKLRRMRTHSQGRILRSPTFFEDVLKTMLTTNTTWGGTKRMLQNLVEQFGEPLPAEPARHAFPTPHRLSASTEAELRSVTRLGYRSPYILELAQHTASAELDLESFKTSQLDTPDLRKELLSIKGIGAYAAANLLMLLGRYDYLPVDSWALKMVSLEWYQGAAIGVKEVEQAFERWGKWKGLAYWFWNWENQG
jgi:3-methyladenine DNA glycosylase/8-oxoguanine DNA glycosylase